MALFILCAALARALKRGDVFALWFVIFLTLLLWQNLSPVCHILHFWHFCYDKFCPIFATSYTFGTLVMTNFVPFLSHLTLLALLLWQILSHFCHILHFLSFCYDKFCPQFVTSSEILSNFCHIFWIFIQFLCIKCIFWHFVPFLSHFLSHGTNFVTFLTPQKPSNTKGFHDWSKICHIF